MFERLKKLAERQRSGRAAVDPSVFGDPLALGTGWHPVAPGGASFGTHRLKQTSAHRLEFAPTPTWKLFSLVFFLAGSGVLAFHLGGFPAEQSGFSDPDTYVPLIVGVTFSAAGACMWWFGSTPRVFDQSRGMFWRGRKEPSMMIPGGEKGSSIPFSGIHALQLVSEYVSGNRSSYTSYELNLVLADGDRINVVDHGNLEDLRADAQILARFLDKPVWDATRH